MRGLQIVNKDSQKVLRHVVNKQTFNYFTLLTLLRFMVKYALNSEETLSFSIPHVLGENKKIMK